MRYNKLAVKILAAFFGLYPDHRQMERKALTLV
jgi:hypothetical protein